jgi:hypothetical protein
MTLSFLLCDSLSPFQNGFVVDGDFYTIQPRFRLCYTGDINRLPIDLAAVFWDGDKNDGQTPGAGLQPRY